MADYQSILREFHKRKLQYLIVGGVAVNLHGYPRFTNDIDILLALDHNNLAIMAGIMEIVPYGILVALIPAFSFSYISSGLASALMVSGAYLIIHQFEVFLFTPLIIRHVVGLSPVVIILSALVGYELGGFWGILLAIPIAVVIMEYLTDVEKDKILARAGQQ